MKLSQNQKVAIYAGVGAGTYMLYQKYKLNDIYNKFQKKIEFTRASYFSDIPNIYKSIDKGEHDWYSSNLSKGSTRTLKSGERDMYDDKKYFHCRGHGEYTIDGDGTLKMSASGPRIYFNPNKLDSKVTEPDMDWIFKNTEFTLYYKAKARGDAGQGIVMGCRSHPNGHAIKSEELPETAVAIEEDEATYRELISNYKYANTYYAKIRNDGRIGFHKEMHHFNGNQKESKFNRQAIKFTETLETKYTYPLNKWVGVKFCCYNIKNTGKVKLEVWIDDVSNGEATKTSDIKNWRLLASKIDSYGFWPCDVNADVLTEEDYEKYKKNEKPDDPLVDRMRAFTDSYGCCIIRNSGAESFYKNISIREIDEQEEDDSLKSTPSPVRNFRYTEYDDKTVTFQWDKPQYGDKSNQNSDVAIKDYKITSGTATPVIIKGDTLTTRKGGLEMGRQYVFLIQARNTRNDNYSDPTTLILTKDTLRIKEGTPSAPPSITITKRRDPVYDSQKGTTVTGAVRIDWSTPTKNSTGQLKYKIYTGSESITEENYLIKSGLNQPERNYYFKISASNDGGVNYGHVSTATFILQDYEVGDSKTMYFDDEGNVIDNNEGVEGESLEGTNYTYEDFIN